MIRWSNVRLSVVTCPTSMRSDSTTGAERTRPTPRIAAAAGSARAPGPSTRRGPSWQRRDLGGVLMAWDAEAVKDALEERNIAFEERELDHGIQLRIATGEVVNAFQTGTVHVSGKSTPLRDTLAEVFGSKSSPAASPESVSREVFVVYGGPTRQGEQAAPCAFRRSLLRRAHALPRGAGRNSGSIVPGRQPPRGAQSERRAPAQRTQADAAPPRSPRRSGEGARSPLPSHLRDVGDRTRTEPRSTTAPCVDGELMPQRQVLSIFRRNAPSRSFGRYPGRAPFLPQRPSS